MGRPFAFSGLHRLADGPRPRPLLRHELPHHHRLPFGFGPTLAPARLGQPIQVAEHLVGRVSQASQGASEDCPRSPSAPCAVDHHPLASAELAQHGKRRLPNTPLLYDRIVRRSAPDEILQADGQQQTQRRGVIGTDLVGETGPRAPGRGRRDLPTRSPPSLGTPFRRAAPDRASQDRKSSGRSSPRRGASRMVRPIPSRGPPERMPGTGWVTGSRTVRCMSGRQRRPA